MKKITLLAVAFIAISFASCKKDYTCTCTTVETTYTSVTVIKAKTSKSSGQAWCDAAPNATTTVAGVAVTGGAKPTCVLN